ncbi:Integral membrane protein [Penicillium digitatum]|uniref:Integral membrane protein n=2 Tax=Penicillium digitatum TaxID=36651 RepID=K9FDN0_PEND1|nr:Integral membrane protein [Penicillium digitatum Pd1]EKV06282.1 Integral membrane protein [Penicillium digitatum Pd1]QQK40591.1 Integral membrane protein [Penicillium digitatum]
MNFDNKYAWQNMTQALPLELGLQVSGTALGYVFATLVTPIGLVWTTQSHLWSIIGIQILRTTFVMLASGRDSNHVVYKTAPKDPNWIFAGPEYHALHHVYPDRYMGSFIKLFDWVWGTAYSVRGKRFVITGGGGALGQAIVAELEQEGVQNIRSLEFGVDWDHQHFAKAIAALSACDVLILAHGTQGQDAVESNCNSAVQLVRLFKQNRSFNQTSPTLPEVWYIGSEIELHPSFGKEQLQRYSQSKRRFLPHARSFFDDPDIIYRHIVPSVFQSPLGLVPASLVASYTMCWIRRGARYIPVTYTGVAYLNYFKLMYWVPRAQDTDQM